MTLRVEYRISSADDIRTQSHLSSTSAPSRRTHNWIARWTAPLLLFLVGCFALGYYAYAILDAHFFQDDQSRKFDQALQNAHDKAALDLSAEAAAELKARAKSGHKTVAMPEFNESDAANSPGQNQIAAGNIPLGRIEIASLGLSAMIGEGTGAQTLRRGVGHITGTASLGESGNVGLAAHRDTFFRKLRDIHKGDEIKLTTLAGSFLYRVELISIVEPEESSVLRDSGDSVLTLVTCYPFGYIGPAPKRFIVRARQLPPKSATVAAIN